MQINKSQGELDLDPPPAGKAASEPARMALDADAVVSAGNGAEPAEGPPPAPAATGDAGAAAGDECESGEASEGGGEREEQPRRAAGVEI